MGRNLPLAWAVCYRVVMNYYFRVWQMFFRNALIRELAFRGNFVITILTRLFWFAAQITLF